MPYRILITTHHITSRAKIQRLARAAEQIPVSILIKKTRKPYGIMICEGDTERQAREWLAIVKGLRYKGYRFIKGEQLPGPRCLVHGKDGVQIVDGTKEFHEQLESAPPDFKNWWAAAMKQQST